MRSFDADLQADAAGSVVYNAAPPGYDWSDLTHWDGGHFDLERAEAAAAYSADVDLQAPQPEALPEAPPAVAQVAAAVGA
eukprot:3240026-Rhodomonas_salina.1